MIKRPAFPSGTSRLAFLFAVIGVTMAALPVRNAFAYPQVQCVPTDIAYTPLGYEIIQCGGINYNTWTSGAPAGCGTQTIDTVKIWTSMAQAALMSGKKLAVTYATCTNGQFEVIQLDLLQ